MELAIVIFVVIFIVVVFVLNHFRKLRKHNDNEILESIFLVLLLRPPRDESVDGELLYKCVEDNLDYPDWYTKISLRRVLLSMEDDGLVTVLLCFKTTTKNTRCTRLKDQTFMLTNHGRIAAIACAIGLVLD